MGDHFDTVASRFRNMLARITREDPDFDDLQETRMPAACERTTDEIPATRNLEDGVQEEHGTAPPPCRPGRRAPPQRGMFCHHAGEHAGLQGVPDLNAESRRSAPAPGTASARPGRPAILLLAEYCRPGRRLSRSSR